MEVAINDEQFYSRLNKFLTHWNQNKETIWENTNIICIPMGAVKNADVVYSKSSAMHLYLLGYEFPESLMILTPNKFYFITTQKKAAYLEAIKDESKFPIETFYKTKDENANKEMFKSLLSTLKKTHGATTIGTILKGEFEGKFIPLWNETVASQSFTTVDVSRGLGVLLSIKDATELVRSSLLSPISTLMTLTSHAGCVQTSLCSDK
jgi:nucleosome binding factor SPN SPT16 subunit